VWPHRRFSLSSFFASCLSVAKLVASARCGSYVWGEGVTYLDAYQGWRGGARCASVSSSNLFFCLFQLFDLHLCSVLGAALAPGLSMCSLAALSVTVAVMHDAETSSMKAKSVEARGGMLHVRYLPMAAACCEYTKDVPKLSYGRSTLPSPNQTAEPDHTPTHFQASRNEKTTGRTSPVSKRRRTSPCPASTATA